MNAEQQMKIARNASTAALLRRLWAHLSPRRRRLYFVLLCLMFISGVAEIVSLGTVIPFIGILAAPSQAFDQPFIAAVAGWLDIDSPDELALPFTLAFGAAAVLAGVIRILVVKLSTRLTFATGADISLEVYQRTLYQPYEVHTGMSSSETISGITGKVGQTILGVLLPVLTLVSSCVLLVAIVGALIAIDAVIAFIAAIGFGTCYGIVTWFWRSRLRRNSQRIADEHARTVKALQEGLGGIRDVLLSGTQPLYCEIYRIADQRWRLAQGDNIFIAKSPRFAVEALGMVLIAGLAFGLSQQPGGLVSTLPVLGAIALGAQRLLPAMQQGYAAWSTIQGAKASFADTVELLDQPLPEADSDETVKPLRFLESICFDNVRFRYGNTSEWVLNDFSLEVPKGSRVGIVGSTGSGKSTAMDLLMGLLKPTRGQILVDGQPLDGQRVRAWQQLIAHVPQSIFLSDATIAENIAFGIPRQEIDHERVRKAARRALIAEFVDGQPGGYETIVGERGVRLSGGQRQRIGIARALYREASVLVLDEATSALDTSTENSVMNAIDSLASDLTVFIIAHRLTTVRSCDVIVEVGEGRIVGLGTYEDVIGSQDARGSVLAVHLSD